MEPQPLEGEFTEFLDAHGPGLRHAFIARYGPEVGGEVMQDVAAYAFEHWDRVSGMANPSGWLFRVGQSRSRRYLRRPLRLPPPIPDREILVEPALPALIQALPEKQRVAVLLTHAFGYTVREAADIVGVSASTMHQNAGRGLEKLRSRMGVPSDA